MDKLPGIGHNSQNMEETKKTEKTPKQKQKNTRGTENGFSLTPLNDGFYLRIRHRKYGTHYEKLDVKSRPEAVVLAQRQLAILKDIKQGNQDRRLKEIKLSKLLLAAIEYKTNTGKWVGETLKDNIQLVNTFLKYDGKTCNKFLSEITYKDFEDHINRRLKEDQVKPYTIRRMLAPIITIYRDASTTNIFDLAPGFTGVLPVPFDHVNIKKMFREETKDTSGREPVLNRTDDLKIYQAINAKCRTRLTKRRVLTAVHLALSTAQRRGVILKLKWGDFDFPNKVINIPRTYYTAKKPAPSMIPISSQLEKELLALKDALPDWQKKPECKLFPNKHEINIMEHPFVTPTVSEYKSVRVYNTPKHLKELGITNIRKDLGGYNSDLVFKDGKPVVKRQYKANYQLPNNHKKVGDTRWFDDVWGRIIRSTDLIQDDGTYLHFHDLRHIALTRYDQPPYDLSDKHTNYLQGVKVSRYKHPEKVALCNAIREKIEIGDAFWKEHEGLTPRDIADMALNPQPNRAMINGLRLSRITGKGRGELPTPEEWQRFLEWTKTQKQNQP